MKRDMKNIDDVVREHLPSASQKEMEADIDHLFERLHSTPIERPVEGIEEPVRPARRWQWPAVAAIAAAVVLAVLLPSRIVQSAPAVLEDADGKRQIQYGELVRPIGDMSAMLSITDGPRVETRSMSEFSLERTDDGGTKIRLNAGGLIVDAASQPSGNLVVQTKDMTARVSGAVSLVKAGEEGSRVAAIGGEVRVQQGSQEKTLRAGEQVATNPRLEPLSVKDELAWSRQSEAHLAMLVQATVTTAPPQERIAFDPVSIRLAGSPPPAVAGARGGGDGANSRPTKEGCSFGSLGYTVQLDPRRLAVTRVTVFHLIAWAYPITSIPAPNDRIACGFAGGIGLISGGPEWIRTDMWDIQAGIPEGAFSSKPMLLDPKIREMLRTLLAERVNLSMHRETREMPVYLLTQTKGGAKFNGRRPRDPRRRLMIDDANGNVVEATPEQEAEYMAALQGIWRIGSQFDAAKVAMSELALEITRALNRPVFDRTGLTGTFEFYLDLQAPAPEGTPRANRVSIDLRTALQQVGLQLEEARASLDVWVIDRVDKPSEN